MMNNKNFDFKTTLSHTLEKFKPRMGQNDQRFLQRIYSEGIDKYKDRLRAISFVGHERVLDAGCGYGQWSLALAELNQTVSACDMSSLRVDFLSNLVKNLSVSNLDF